MYYVHPGSLESEVCAHAHTYMHAHPHTHACTHTMGIMSSRMQDIWEHTDLPL